MNTELVKMTLHEMFTNGTQDKMHTKYRQNGIHVFMSFQAFNSLFRRLTGPDMTSEGGEFNVM